MREMGSWRDYQIERLANDREAAIDYLQLTLEEYLVDGDLPFFLKGLQTFVESQGGVSEFSKHTSIEPEIFLGSTLRCECSAAGYAQEHTEHP